MNAETPIAGDTGAALAFLAALRPSGWINLVVFDPAGGPPTGITRRSGHADLAAFIQRHNGRANLYYMLNEPRPDAPDRKLTKDDVARYVAVAVDLDPHRSQDLQAERERLQVQAETLLTDPVTPPSFSIDSGGGFQHIWMLDRPIEASPAAQIAVEEQGRGLARHFGGDHTHNVDRILRLPGTINIPTPEKAQRGRVMAPARLLEATGERYALDNLRALAAPMAAPEKDRTSPIALDMGLVTAATTYDELEQGLRAKFEGLWKRDATVKQLWQGDRSARPGDDDSHSGFLWALAAALRRCGGFEAGEFAQLAWVWGHGHNPAKDENQMEREIGRAWEAVPPGAAEEFAAAPPPESSADKVPTTQRPSRLSFRLARDVAPKSLPHSTPKHRDVIESHGVCAELIG